MRTQLLALLPLLSLALATEMKAAEGASMTSEMTAEAAPAMASMGGEMAPAMESMKGEAAPAMESMGAEAAPAMESMGGEAAPAKEESKGGEAAPAMESMGGEAKGDEAAPAMESMGGEAAAAMETMKGEAAPVMESMMGEAAPAMETMKGEAAPAMETMAMEAPAAMESMGGEAAAPAEGGGEAAMTMTESAASPYMTPQYGSGAEMQVTDLNSCMQMCQAKFGGGGMAPPAEGGAAEAPPSGTAPEAGAATHTIIVAPTQGVLRFVPFAVTANPGDTLHYIWGGNMHSVTESDGQNVCNKSTTAEAFDSGVFNATKTFDQVVKNNASTPQFFYCKVGKHCASGMFGVINPPASNVSNDLTDMATKTKAPIPDSTAGNGGGAQCMDNSMGCWIDKWAGGGKRQKQIHDGVKKSCDSQPAAWEWGSKWDMSGMETTVVTKEVIIENVMYSRYMMATNPAMLVAGGPVPSNWTAPPDLNSFVVDNSAETASVGPASSTAPASASASASGNAQAEGANAGTNGAGRVGSSMGLVAAVGLGLGLLL